MSKLREMVKRIIKEEAQKLNEDDLSVSETEDDIAKMKNQLELVGVDLLDWYPTEVDYQREYYTLKINKLPSEVQLEKFKNLWKSRYRIEISDTPPKILVKYK